MKQIDYLIIGHVAKDVRENGFTFGGTVVYAAVAAARLGRRVAVVTACQSGIDLQGTLPSTPISFAPSLTSTVFENAYRDGRRAQHLFGRAAALEAKHVPPLWRTSRLVHLAPIAQEITPEIVDIARGGFVGLTAQGWLRGWDSDGRVGFKLRDRVEAALPRLSAVVFSEEDAEGRADVIEFIAGLTPVAVVTLGERGAKVHWAGEWRHFPAFPARQVDPTGAGDVFAAAFFHRLERTKDPHESAVFANCAARFAVEVPGTAGIPTLEMVERRLKGNT